MFKDTLSFEREANNAWSCRLPLSSCTLFFQNIHNREERLNYCFETRTVVPPMMLTYSPARHPHSQHPPLRPLGWRQR